MSDFKVGDICVLIDHKQHSTEGRAYVGREFEITSLTARHPRWDCQVRALDDGKEADACFRVLRKKQPPAREPTSTWDDVIVWRPKETTHV